MFYSRVGNGWLRSTCILHVLLPLSGIAFKAAPPCDEDDDTGDYDAADDDDADVVLMPIVPRLLHTYLPEGSDIFPSYKTMLMMMMVIIISSFLECSLIPAPQEFSKCPISRLNNSLQQVS